MKRIILILGLLFCLTTNAQSGEFSTSDLKRVMAITQFKGASGLLKQVNINSWGVCEYKKIDNFSTYNYYYKKISRETFDLYCKELNALMLLDGIIPQLK
jgi:hypothetical protein